MTFIVDGSLGGTFPTWTTATRPATPTVGQEGFNTTNGVLEVYNGSVWFAAGTIAPQITTYTSGSGTYTTPAGAKYLVVQMVGGGGGGCGTGTPGSAGGGGTGGTTTFGSSFLTCLGGYGGSQPPGATYNSIPTGGDINATGTAGNQGVAVPNSIYNQGGTGGPSVFGGAGNGGYVGAVGNPGFKGSGGGGGGMDMSATSTGVYMGGGGASGGYLLKVITSPASSYSYAVGAGGTAGAAGSTGQAGGAGGAGFIVVTAYF